MLKPKLEELQSFRESSFLVRAFEETAFSAPYHYHPEYELTYIVKGSGTRYVGSHMGHYHAGDLVLLGSDLPHCWKSADIVPGEKNAVSVVVQFRGDCLGASWLHKPEFKLITTLLQKSTLGICFGEPVTSVVAGKLLALPVENDALKRLLSILDILHFLAGTGEFDLLEKRRSLVDLSDADRSRNHAVMAYIVENFKEHISLKKAAELVSMTPPAFCKSFRKINGKTLTEVVTDYRLDHALRLIVQTDKTMAEISFESGFFDLSNFYKVFKKRFQSSPLGYRKTFLKHMS